MELSRRVIALRTASTPSGREAYPGQHASNNVVTKKCVYTYRFIHICIQVIRLHTQIYIYIYMYM